VPTVLRLTYLPTVTAQGTGGQCGVCRRDRRRTSGLIRCLPAGKMPSRAEH